MPIIIKHIKPSDVVGIVDTTGEITDHTMITAMGLLRVGYDTIAVDAGEHGLMDKVNKLLKI